jgi:hypothetical protein
MVADHKLNAEPNPIATTTPQAPLPQPVAALPGESTPAAESSEPTRADVVQALAWLGQKSLNEYRLTSPDQDNAYYYFSRLLQLEPDNEIGRRGLLKTAERFAELAERELAKNNLAQAQDYVNIGLQLDPNNPVLQALQDLSQPGERGFVQALRGWFRSG